MRKKILILSFISLLFIPFYAQDTQTIHIMVALCDNKYRGIVKVPKELVMGKTRIQTSIGDADMGSVHFSEKVSTGKK